MKFEIITIFPDFFRGPLQHGIVRRAIEAEIIDVRVHDLRAFTHDRHRTVDDRPFGGGEGMLLKPEPIFECAESLAVSPREARVTGRATESVILLSPRGELLTQDVAARLAALDRLVLICGRYEGVDERVSEHLADREISVGDYVLSGGELPAALVVDAVSRLLPGALGNESSARQESFTNSRAEKGKAQKDGHKAAHHDRNNAPSVPDSTCASGGLLDYPQYTRPAEFRGMKVPEELVSGNHDEIRRWRRQRALEKTFHHRPELLEGVELSAEDRDFLHKLRQQTAS
jgi:tRNA (guanine37-N1)-methyltransferase